MHSNQSPGLPARPISGRYRLLERLGGGSFADTYLADDLQLERQVAIKLLRASPHDSEAAARFEREIQAAAAVHHPNVVAIYDAGEHEGRPFLVMEWVGGSDLKGLIREHAPLPVDEAVAIMRDVLQGLGAIHRAGIVHRDVKPQNILITESGTAKVADFGIARSSLDTGLTETGIVLGTAAYLAPERAVGGDGTGAAADIYAAGVILFEMLTGRLPFEADNAAGLLYQHVHEPPPKPRELNREIPQEIEAAILTAMTKDPAARYPSADAMQTALDGESTAVIASDQPTRAMTAITGHPAPRRRPAAPVGRYFPIPVAMTALVLGTLGLMALLGGFTSFGGGLPGIGDGSTPTPGEATPTEERVVQPAATATATASPTPTAALPPTATPEQQPEEAAPESPLPTGEPAPENPPPTEQPEPAEDEQDDLEDGEDGEPDDDGDGGDDDDAEDENPGEEPPGDPGNGDDGDSDNHGQGPPDNPGNDNGNGNGNDNPGQGPPENPGNGNGNGEPGNRDEEDRQPQNSPGRNKQDNENDKDRGDENGNRGRGNDEDKRER